MSESSDAGILGEARALRDEARAMVRLDVNQLRMGLSARPISARIRDRAAEEIVGTLDTARDIASENKAIIGATIAAVAGWLFRRPLFRLAERWLPAIKGD